MTIPFQTSTPVQGSHSAPPEPVAEPFRFTDYLYPLVLALMMILQSPVHAATIDITGGSGWIRGRAENAPLGEVLQKIANLKGYRIYIEDALIGKKVTFVIDSRIEDEKALRRIISPFSHAVVYGKKNDTAPVTIREIKIFQSGSTGGSSFLSIAPHEGFNDPSGPRSLESKDASSMASAIRGNGFQPSGEARTMVRPTGVFQKGPFGSGTYRAKDSGNGPDYRPTTEKMKASYHHFQKEKESYFHQKRLTESRNSHTDYLANRIRYQKMRSEMVKAYVAGPDQP